MKKITTIKKSLSVVCRFIIPALIVVSALSCSSEGDIRQIFTNRSEPPVFLDSRAVSPTEVVFNFSKPVQVTSVTFNPELEVNEIHNGAEVRIVLAQPLEPGKKFTADILVEDANKNTLTAVETFRGRNDRMPKLVFNELRTELSKQKVEFVEFFSLNAGNIGAMKLFVSTNSLTEPLYEFPPAEIQTGEYIVLHMRTLSDESVDETGNDLDLSGGVEALSTARDFWIAGNTKRLHKTCAIWITDQDDKIIDAVVLVEKAADWGKNNTAAAAEFLALSGAWLSPDGDDAEGTWIPGYADAVSTSGTTNTRTINRDESISPQACAGNWYISATSSDTPGRENSTKRYTP
ncbi:MAG: hypothetical protein FWD91_00025 [Treponema sp.]|nr:hypothetical protein [Treponema sp.]